MAPHATRAPAATPLAAGAPRQTAHLPPLQASIPKQYLELQGQPIATYSLRTFAAMPAIREVVVVCEPEWRCACSADQPVHLPPPLPPLLSLPSRFIKLACSSAADL